MALHRRLFTQVFDSSTVRAIRGYDPMAILSRRTAEAAAVRRYEYRPDFIEKMLPLLDLWSRYFSAEVRGLENIPETGPALVVGNHSGGVLTPDTSVLLNAWYRHVGVQRPLVGLGMDAAFSVPSFRDIMTGLGLVPASRKNAEAALDEGKDVLVYPGGAWEVFRPWEDRNLIDFHERTGFLRLAIDRGVPIVPVVGHGGHETLYVVSRGDKLARAFQMTKLRVDVYPILFSFPWGITTAALPPLPMPARVTVTVLPPMRWPELEGTALTDEDLARCYDEVTTRMQAALDAMAEETPRPLATGVESLLSEIRQRSASALADLRGVRA